MTELAVREAFDTQAEACAALGSHFTAHLCKQFSRHLTADTPIGAKVLSWGGDPSVGADSVPLRLCGGLHALALTNRAPALAAAYENPTNTVPDWAAIDETLTNQSAFLMDWIDSPPQTNEVSRAAALWPGFMAIASKVQRPLALLEIGASAGLNLQADRFSYDLGGHRFGAAESAVSLKPEWKGKPPSVASIHIETKAACDLAPLNPARDADALRLTAYVWPDQTERLSRLRAAIALARANPVVVEKNDALVFLENHLSSRNQDLCTIIYSTVAWQYLPKSAQAEGAAIIARHGAQAGSGEIAWLRMENDGIGPGASIDLTLNPGRANEQAVQLGRAHFHGAWVDWKGIA